MLGSERVLILRGTVITLRLPHALLCRTANSSFRLFQQQQSQHDVYQSKLRWMVIQTPSNTWKNLKLSLNKFSLQPDTARRNIDPFHALIKFWILGYFAFIIYLL